jgi:hypothetical protein
MWTIGLLAVTNNFYPGNVLNCSRTKYPFVYGGSLTGHEDGHGVCKLVGTNKLLGTYTCSCRTVGVSGKGYHTENIPPSWAGMLEVNWWVVKAICSQ